MRKAIALTAEPFLPSKYALPSSQLGGKACPAAFRMGFDDVKVRLYTGAHFFGAGVDDAAHDVDGVGLHKVSDALGKKENRVRNNVGENDVVCALHLVRKAAADGGEAVANAVEFGVFGGGLHSLFVNTNSLPALRFRQWYRGAIP